jgi:hypothetical protein
MIGGGSRDDDFPAAIDPQERLDCANKKRFSPKLD